MVLDYDLSTIQEARNLARQAKKAQDVLAGYSASQIDNIVAAMAKVAADNALALASQAVEETGYGIVAHKELKNKFAAMDVYQCIKDMKTVGIIREDSEKRVVEAAVPVGVILGITPTTNPTSTVIHNALVAVKSGNAIVFAPHPNAIKCSAAAAKLLNDAAVKAGGPDGLVSCLTQTSMQATDELMKNSNVSVIVATGGSAMVRAAYSAGKPAFGVGPGNVPAFIERSADVRQAVKDIITSKTFDNGMICASEQAVIADEPVKQEVLNELRLQGCYIMNAEETAKVSAVVMTAKGGMNAALVGRTPHYIADKAGITVPAGTKLLIAPLSGTGTDYPLSFEKLTTVLGFYSVRDWHEACDLSVTLLELGGIGHTFSIHSRDERVIREFIRKPVFRIVVNTPSAFGAIGYSTGLTPSMTLGCGTWGGSSISENLGPQHLVNIKRLVYGTRSVELPAEQRPVQMGNADVQSSEIAAVVRQVLRQLQVG